MKVVNSRLANQTRLWGQVALALALAPGCGPRPDTERQHTHETVFPDGSRSVTHQRDGLVEGRTLLYAPAGHLRGIRYYVHDTLEGPQYLFYPTGRVQTIEANHKGKLEGASYEFYASGRLASRRQMHQNLWSGPFRLYEDTAPGRLREAVDYVLVAGKEHINFSAQYDSLGHVVSHTSRLRMHADHDTVALGDTLLLHLRLEHPRHQELGISTGGYDAQFVLRTPESERRGLGVRHRVTLKAPTAVRGADTVRGYLEDFKTTGPVDSQGNVSVEGRKLYFAYPYFVK